jgi:hypothetical protein
MGQILANGFSALSYGLLGSLSGAWVCLLASIHSVLMSQIRKGNSDSRVIRNLSDFHDLFHEYIYLSSIEFNEPNPSM